MENHLRNPFHYGGVVKGDSFCNRKEEISLLETYIKDRYSVWLYSPRRYGKSSLIQKVFNDTKNIKTIYLDLYNVKSLDDFCKKYASALAKNLFSWNQEIGKLTRTFTDHFKNLHPTVSFDESGNPTFSLEKGEIRDQPDVETILNIPHKISQKLKTPICIAFDEFQEIRRIEPFLINWMRSAFQHHENISYIFLGSQQSLMEFIFASDQSPFYEFAAKMHIDPIRKEEWISFIDNKFKEKGLVISQDNIDLILQKSEGHPHFTQYFASVVFDMIRNGVDQTREDFTNSWMSKIVGGQSVVFQGIYDQLTNVQRSVLGTLAHLQQGEELYSSVIRDKYKLPASSSITTSLKSLSRKGLVLKKDHVHQIVNPIFKEWLLLLD